MEGSPSPSTDVSQITSALKKKASNESVCDALEDLKSLLAAEDTDTQAVGVAVIGNQSGSGLGFRSGVAFIDNTYGPRVMYIDL